jgi:hypothetical protein
MRLFISSRRASPQRRTCKTTPIRPFGKGTDASPTLKAADAIPRTKPPNAKPITEALRQEREHWHESQQIRISSCSLCPTQEARIDKPPPLEPILEPEEKWHRPHFHRQPTSRWQFALKSASEQQVDSRPGKQCTIMVQRLANPFLGLQLPAGRLRKGTGVLPA